MPCTNEFSHYDDAREIQKLTRVACDLVKTLRAGGTEKRPLNSETMVWIAEHDAWDRRREDAERAALQREEARMEALAKLSEADRMALDLQPQYSPIGSRKQEPW